MTRPIVLSNGELHVGINNFGLVHDFYYPYVGLENHAAGKDLRHHVGVWVDGQLSWLDNNAEDWATTFSYPHKGLVGHITATNEKLGVIIEFDDAVDTTMNAFLRNIHVVNMRDEAREVRLFTHQAFAIGDSRSNTDTAQYLPDSNAIMHYRGRRVFIVSGVHEEQPFDQHTVGVFGIEGKEGTWRDAEDGELSMGNVEHGRVDSVLRFCLQLAPHESGRVHYWIAAGTTMRDALQINKTIQESGVDHFMHSTLHWWHTWLEPAHQVTDRMEERHRDEFLRSLMLVKSQIDKRGAVMASTDSAMLNYWRDAYAYCWPRDGAYVLWPLIRLGYTEEPLKFFEFCRRVLHPSGYLMHKFRADGALGSSWHPYVHEHDIVAPPIQQDETALVLFVFAQYYGMHKDTQLIEDFYESMIKPMASFLAEYIEPSTGLPKPSYDLWEEVFLTTTYTTATVYAALLAAGDIAEVAGDADNAVAWRLAADDMYDAAHKHLFNTKRNAFYKGILVTEDGIEYNDCIDTSSVFGAFMFGLFPAKEPELQQAVATLTATLGVDGTPGLPRYEGDNYLRNEHTGTGNPWFISSMWLAQYHIETGDPQQAHDILDWVQSHALDTGVLSEQIDRETGEGLSVAPLTWTHAEYLATILDMITEADDEHA